MRLDFARRVEPSASPELMDEPCTYAQLRACLKDLGQVNRLTLGYRPTLAWLDGLVAAGNRPEILRIVDVGCGGGDMLREIRAWAQRRKVRVHLTGLDLNPFAARAAREFAAGGEEIEFVTGDAFSYAPGEGIDVVVSSLFTHHLETTEIVQFVGWMEAQARVGWFVNDLGRSAAGYYGFMILAGMMRWHRFVRHDGLVSFRRALSREDWERIAVDAGIGPLQMEGWRPGRLCVGRVKESRS